MFLKSLERCNFLLYLNKFIIIKAVEKWINEAKTRKKAVIYFILTVEKLWISVENSAADQFFDLIENLMVNRAVGMKLFLNFFAGAHHRRMIPLAKLFADFNK